MSTTAATRERIEHVVDVASREWKSLADLPAEWAEWDVVEKEVFQVEWGLKESRLDRLRGWHEQGCFSPDQERRYGELLTLVERYRPVLESVFAGE